MRRVSSADRCFNLTLKTEITARMGVRKLKGFHDTEIGQKQVDLRKEIEHAKKAIRLVEIGNVN